MKNFKFRAWDKDHKYMENTDKNLVVCFSDEGVEVTDHTTFSHSCTSMENFELMQSTGLKDKNGTEIYEGDIVKNIYDEIYVVKWFDADFHLEEKYNGGFDYLELYSGDNKKVIGNIYENPELLEG
mgnify:CR=1 FL=1